MKQRIKGLILSGVVVCFAGLLAVGTTQTSADGAAPVSFVTADDETAPVGSEEHTFKILEIVPNESMGMIGYMVAGCEPIDMERLKSEEWGATQNYRDSMVTSGLVTQEKVTAYAFAEDLPPDAEMAGWSGEFSKWWSYTNSAGNETTGYSEFGYYQKVEANQGDFAYDAVGGKFSYAGAGNGDYLWNCVEYYAAVGAGNGDYLRIVSDTDAADLSAWMFAYQGAGNGNYQCTVLNDTTEMDRTVQDVESVYWTYRTESSYYARWYYEYRNNNCLTASIFGEENKDTAAVEVITVTPDKLVGDSLALIDEADMITITAQEYMTAVWDAYNLEGVVRSDAEKQARPIQFLGKNGNDLSWDAVVRIVERMASKTPPAMYLQQSALHVGGNSGEYNVGKLYVMLMQYGANIFKNTFMDGDENFGAAAYTTSDGKETYGGVYTRYDPYTQKQETITNWDAQTFLTEYGESVMHESAFPSGRTGEVFGTILLYNGDTSFLMGYLSQQIGEFDGITGSNTEMFDYYEQQTGTRPETVSMQDAVFYIVGNAIGSGGQEKEQLRILELQPCNKFVYGSSHWQLYYMNLFPWFKGSMEEDVTVTTMTTYQFIGDITDLNSEYDLILIGSSQDASNGLNGYNDTQMGHLIYTAIGDLVTDYDAKWSWNGRADGGADEKMGSDAWQIKSRYSGTDITKKKYEELRDFLAAGSPIVVDAGLYTSDTQVDTAAVDISSYMYRLISGVYREGNTESLLFKSGAAGSQRERSRLSDALRQVNCRLVFPEGGKPLAYSAETEDKTVYYGEVQNNQGRPGRPGNQTTQASTYVTGIIVSEHYNTDTDEYGNPVLRFVFAVEGKTESNYGVKLYLDQNGDGIYNDSIKERKELEAAQKAASSLNATLASEEANADRIQIFDVTSQTAVTDGNLLAGHTYQLIYRVRSTERGILPWKLEIYDKANDSIRCSDTGYTAFRVSGDNVEKEQINVLQMNLMPDMQGEATTYVNFADTATETGAKFKAYLDAVEDFAVNLEFMKNADWYAEFGEKGSKAVRMGYTKEMQIARWKEYLEDYDMLIIGYCDMAAFTNDEIFYEGFIEFVNQGKSVILSHDLVSDASFLYQANYTITEYDPVIRTLAGQRRKYYVGETCYYMYSSTGLNGTEVSLLPPDNFMLWYTDGYGWKQLFQKDFMSSVETNIPADATEYGTADAGTWQIGDASYKMDAANEFMDNSVRLLTSYSRSDLMKDRVLNSSITSYSWPVETEDVEIANRGQITNYPYQIGDTMKVTRTHAQNFQLDLEQEDGGDVTVWYNLTDAYDSDVNPGGSNDGVYSARSGDSRNNYYMYTKGNITYTGLGHTSAGLTNDEVKLFVNTMISSYRDVPEVPYARVTNAEATEHKGNYTLYVVLTGAEDADAVIPVDFTIADENDQNITSIRTYQMQYLDAEGNLLTEQTATVSPAGNLLVYHSDTNSYQVERNGRYTFEVPCREVIENGEAVYYLNVSSSYRAGTKEYTTSKTTKVVVYAMPLFTLH